MDNTLPPTPLLVDCLLKFFFAASLKSPREFKRGLPHSPSLRILREKRILNCEQSQVKFGMKVKFIHYNFSISNMGRIGRRGERKERKRKSKKDEGEKGGCEGRL